jgi:phosphate transport system permease protein
MQKTKNLDEIIPPTNTAAHPNSRSQLIQQALGGERKFDLSKRPRIGESIISGLLFVAGIFSVFTTLFIVIYLGREALGFLNTSAWVPARITVINTAAPVLTLDTERDAALTTSSTQLQIAMNGLDQVPYTTNSLIQLGDEVMRVTERRERSVIVQRAVNGTTASAHEAGAPIMVLTAVPIRSLNALTDSATDTVINVQEGYTSGFKVGESFELEGGEIVTISALTPSSITVARGQRDTVPAPQPADTPLRAERRADLIQFFSGTEWQPQTGNFGVLPLVVSTLVTTVIAILVAMPLGLGVAVYLSEYASQRTRGILGPILELLVGVPTVVYGFFAVQFVTQGVLMPLLGDSIGFYNMLSAGIVVGIMIIPTIASMSTDAMSAVPRSLREASYGLGATKFETTVKVVLPAAVSGIVAAVILGISRAVGETMIVALAAGAGPNFTFNPLQGAETMAGHIVRISGGDLSYGSIDYESIFAIGVTLFFITFVLTQISTYITQRFREVYE